MKALFGSIVVDGRGKLGGHVFSKNRGGAYVRTKVTPVNPQTSAQVLVRARLAQLSQDWRTITQDQRNAWNAAVADYQRTDIFGALRSPSGQQLYVRVNSNILIAGGVQIAVPPPVTSSPDFVTFTPSADESTPAFDITFAPTPVPANTSYIVECTPPVSPGRNFVKNLYRIVQVFPAADVSPTAIITAYQAKFGLIAVDDKIGVRVTAIDKTTGLRSQATQETVIVSA